MTAVPFTATEGVFVLSSEDGPSVAMPVVIYAAGRREKMMCVRVLAAMMSQPLDVRREREGYG